MQIAVISVSDTTVKKEDKIPLVPESFVQSNRLRNNFFQFILHMSAQNCSVAIAEFGTCSCDEKLNLGFRWMPETKLVKDYVQFVVIIRLLL